MFNSFKRVVGLGWQNLARDGGIAVANVFIIMIPIILTSALLILKDVSDFLVNGVQEKADISVYFNESVPQDDILKVQDRIKQIPGITQVKYVSKEEALQEFRQRHQNNAMLLESLDEVSGNPLYSSLNVSAASTAPFSEVAGLLEQSDYKDMVNRVNYNEKKEVIQKVFELTAAAQKIGLALFLALGAISVMVTFNTVRMAIFSRKREIGIQRLVGASRWFIRGQFLVEGLIFGILGAIFSFFVVAAACWYFNPGLATSLPGMDLWGNFSANAGKIFAAQAGIGAGLGMLSSMIAVGRYLKV